MKIDIPVPGQVHKLCSLWHLAFGDEEAFMDAFFTTGFSPERCLCVTENDTVTAALYWFPALCEGQSIAYIYGVATHPEYRGRGLCRKLMEKAHDHLRTLGFSGCILVPQQENLRQMYRKLGYRDCTSMTEFFCMDDPYPVPIHSIDGAEYAELRKSRLPKGSVIQEGVHLEFLSTYAKFYKGLDFIMAASLEGDSLFAMEYLGNRESAPGILCALGCSQGSFRTPGDKTPFSMFHPLREDAVVPSYFAFAFD